MKIYKLLSLTIFLTALTASLTPAYAQVIRIDGVGHEFIVSDNAGMQYVDTRPTLADKRHVLSANRTAETQAQAQSRQTVAAASGEESKSADDK